MTKKKQEYMDSIDLFIDAATMVEVNGERAVSWWREPDREGPCELIVEMSEDPDQHDFVFGRKELGEATWDPNFSCYLIKDQNGDYAHVRFLIETLLVPMKRL